MEMFDWGEELDRLRRYLQVEVGLDRMEPKVARARYSEAKEKFLEAMDEEKRRLMLSK